VIYQDVYSQIRPVNMFGAFQEAKQARDLEQQRQNTLAEQARAAAQKAQENVVRNGQLATQALIGFKKLSPQQKAAQWTPYRQRIESLVPEAKGSLPSTWDSNDPTNDAELDTLIGGWSSTFFQPEQVKLGAEETLLQVQPGVGPVEIARGMGKADTDKLVRLQGVQDGQPVTLTEREFINAEGFKQSGTQIYPDDYPQGVDKDAYYKAMGITPAQKQPAQAPSVRATNSPSNRAGETNEGFPIDMSMVAPGQPVNALAAMNMPSGGMAPPVAPQMGAVPVAPPVNAMAVPFAGGMGMALPVDMQQVSNMLAQEQNQFMPPNQFAQLRPAGSAPNRFGSPGVEGMEFAATGPVDARGIPLSAIGSSRPRYVATDKGQVKEVFRPMTSDEIKAEGQDPAKLSGRISQFGVIQWNPAKPTAAQIRKEGAEVATAEATAAQNLAAVRRARSEVVSFLRGVRQYRSVLNKLGEQQFVDTGPLDTLVTQFTGLGSELDGLKETVGSELQSAMKVAGDPKTKEELDEMVGQLPRTSRRLYQNFKNLNFREEYFLDRLGVQTSVANDAEFDALTPGTTFVDLNDGGIYRKMKAKQ
jgi:hypothetical protein